MGGVSSLVCCASTGFEGVESKFSSKLNNPKVSIIKKSPKIKKIPQINEKNELFLIALIDDLIYNRICVNIVGKCTLSVISGNIAFFGSMKKLRSPYTMRKNIKKLIGIALASTMALATLAGCSGKNYTGNKLDGFDEANVKAEAISNGGFVAKKGDYVYFINGQESNTADNTYGKVTKGALLRIKASDLAEGNYDKTDVVVPMLFVSQNFDAGIYLYGDSVYYATPTTDKDLDGNVENTLIDFKSAKLDGSEAMKSKYFQLTSNSVQYRYVQDKTSKVVYCLYVDGTDLHSFNTSNGDDVVLVKGADK